ncbi:MAG: hypothetical protein RMK18_00330 [Armatimonadota bacterium]|nr:hypothetical protein [Armatimonadota bacterium]MCX7776506.1 hypothetical protein [Armatimonadota bacterium]MDW8024303.1 hypothetical protein [Armatimonadota bacterium]
MHTCRCAILLASFAVCCALVMLMWHETATENAPVFQGASGGQFELVKIYCEGQQGSSIKLLLRSKPIEVVARGGAVIEWSQGRIRSDTVIAKLAQRGVQGKGILGTIILAEAIGNVKLDIKVEVESGRRAHVIGSCKHLQIDPKESLLIMTGSPQITVGGISPEVSQALGKAGKIVMHLESGELIFEPGDEQLIPEINVQFERKPSEKVLEKKQ